MIRRTQALGVPLAAAALSGGDPSRRCRTLRNPCAYHWYGLYMGYGTAECVYPGQTAGATRAA